MLSLVVKFNPLHTEGKIFLVENRSPKSNRLTDNQLKLNYTPIKGVIFPLRRTAAAKLKFYSCP